MKTLPEKYYRDHFLEFLRYVEEVCAHLLDPHDNAIVKKIHALSEDGLCLLVRMLNRKWPCVALDTLNYSEISDISAALIELERVGFALPMAQVLQRPEPTSLQTPLKALFLNQLTKPQLQQLAAELELPQQPNKSATKAAWLQAFEPVLASTSFAEPAQDLAGNSAALASWSSAPSLASWLYVAEHRTFHYFRYLYFGHVRGTLNQFSMRDLGVMNTRQALLKGNDDDFSNLQARFQQLTDGKDAWFWASELAAFKNSSTAQRLAFAEHCLTLQRPTGYLAEQEYGALLYQLGKFALNETEGDLALQLLQRSPDPRAIEKYLRLLYQAGNTAIVEEKLNEIVENPESEHLLYFALDFLQRKFEKKRTSILTDILRSCDTPVILDEAHKDQVEKGIQQHYQRRGALVWRTENRLWRALFGMTYWPILFREGNGFCNEFDRLPLALREQSFWRDNETEIRALFAELDTPGKWLRHLMAIAAQFYGTANGVFRWHSALLEIFSHLLQYTPVDDLAQVLMDMSQDFLQRNDGYPDLLVIDKGQLRFEEIKAPGDSLRRNQLMSMRRLQQAGFNVVVQTVQWQVDPEQPYIVVDVETTGGAQGYHRIIEIGLVKVCKGAIIEEWQSLINPERHIPRFITELTGINNDMVANAPRFHEVMPDLERFFADAIFVAHNVNFDYSFFRSEYERLGHVFRLPKICTVQRMRHYFPGCDSYSLGALCKSFDIQLTNHHRALDDARAAAELLLLTQAQAAEQLG
ncbi:MAG: VRR-NUC domain-containing protein [Aliidiomarina sp.]|uniref:exonuclease domain-containing protein n=1 Tax=Aliidiomarina sp. TaxID=1872439 RepID=UPI0025C5CE18|nr:exonuclease domain-containing protein [Aliidiomarina sp.]MCH8500830.1 VRR-NUC domain-containing protein [Aliidiomarina sp.]